MVTHDSVDGTVVSNVALREAVALCESLKAVDFFKALTPTEITNVAERLRKRRYSAGDVVIRQGELGDDFFIIASGAVTVTVQNPDEPDRELARFGTGDFFGEVALISGAPRNATVRAVEDLETYVLAAPDFRAALDLSAAFRDQVIRAYFQRH